MAVIFRGSTARSGPSAQTVCDDLRICQDEAPADSLPQHGRALGEAIRWFVERLAIKNLASIWNVHTTTVAVHQNSKRFGRRFHIRRRPRPQGTVDRIVETRPERSDNARSAWDHFLCTNKCTCRNGSFPSGLSLCSRFSDFNTLRGTACVEPSLDLEPRCRQFGLGYLDQAGQRWAAVQFCGNTPRWSCRVMENFSAASASPVSRFRVEGRRPANRAASSGAPTCPKSLHDCRSRTVSTTPTPSQRAV